NLRRRRWKSPAAATDRWQPRRARGQNGTKPRQIMPHTSLNALSPLDGRYFNKAASLSDLFSEFGLIKLRVRVEIEWLKTLARARDIAEVPEFSTATVRQLDALATGFSERDAEAVKAIEARTNHDVKALEYWLKERLADSSEVQRVAEFIHFACTSEDINNLCHALMVQSSRSEILLPALDRLIDRLTTLAHDLADLPMLSRTHGQAATPTTLGKEMANFVARLRRARARIADVSITGKINGAVGNYNAHLVVYPAVDWPALSRGFVEALGLEFNPYT